MGDGHLLVRQETPARKSRCLPATSRGVGPSRAVSSGWRFQGPSTRPFAGVSRGAGRDGRTNGGYDGRFIGRCLRTAIGSPDMSAGFASYIARTAIDVLVVHRDRAIEVRSAGFLAAR